MTKVSAALSGVRRLAIDTAPLIYLVERHSTYGPLMSQILARVDAEGIELITSTLTLTEVLTVPLQQGAEAIAESYRAILLDSSRLRILPIDVSVADRAARLRARHRLKTPDALQIAVALQASCDAFLTNDQRLGRVEDLPILMLSDLQLD